MFAASVAWFSPSAFATIAIAIAIAIGIGIDPSFVFMHDPNPCRSSALLKRHRSAWIKSDLQNKEPVISFPIATYNRADILIERTIPSILDQGYERCEIVIIGDGMNPQQFKHLATLDFPGRVRSYNLSRRSAYPADPFEMWCVVGARPRNIAAYLARGAWHWWISDDDMLEPGSIMKLLHYINNYGETESIYGDYTFYDHRGNPTIHSLETTPAPLPFPMTGMPSWINRSYLSRLFRWSNRSYINSINKPSDYDLQVRMHQAGVSFGYCNQILSSIIADPKYNGLHGSSLYRSFPECFC